MEITQPRNPLLPILSMAFCSLFTSLIIIGAFIRIPFPLVPITLQTLFVILSAMLIGPRLAAISVGLYLFLGLIGLPVFTKGGGPGYVFQPTFGYLIGFLFAAMLVGFLVQKISPVSKFAFFYYWGAGFLGVVLVYLTGMGYLYLIMRFYLKTPVAFSALFTIPFLLTIAGDMFKCLVAAFLARRLRPISKSILNQ